jgi:predicted secreted protein
MLVSAAQGVLPLSAIQFHLSSDAEKALDDQRIVAAYAILNQRIATLAKAMGRSVGDAQLEKVDVETELNDRYLTRALLAPGVTRSAVPLTDPSFEPGETALQMRIVGKVKFK